MFAHGRVSRGSRQRVTPPPPTGSSEHPIPRAFRGLAVAIGTTMLVYGAGAVGGLSALDGILRAARAEDPSAPQIPDPKIWGTAPADSSGPANVAPVEDANRRPVARMVWKTVTSPGGRSFQVLVPATPEELAALGSTPAAGAGQDSDGIARPAVGDGSSPPPVPASDLVMAGELGRPRGRSGTNLPPRVATPEAAPYLPPVTAFGVYAGISSIAGIQMTIPTDATLAFRTGLTGFPGAGWLWTPGLELRFAHEPGTFSTDGVYGFTNLYIGETTTDDSVDKHWGAETGAGYRWILPDRRGVRWIAAIELGGRWTPKSSAPKTPTIRAFWMIAAP